MNAEIFAARAQLEKERGIPQQYMIDKITQALVAAYKKDKEGYTDNVFVEVEDGDLKMYVQKEVVDDVLTPATEQARRAGRSGKRRRAHPELRAHRCPDRQAGHHPGHPRGRARHDLRHILVERA